MFVIRSLSLRGLQGAVNVLKEYLEENASVHTLYHVVEPMCVFFLNKSHGYNSRYMCPGLIYTYFPVVSKSIVQYIHKQWYIHVHVLVTCVYIDCVTLLFYMEYVCLTQ